MGVEGAEEEEDDVGEGIELGGVAGGREERRERAVCDRGDELGIGFVGVLDKYLLWIGGVVPVGSKCSLAIGRLKSNEEKEERKEEENNANENEKKIDSEAHLVLSHEPCLGFRGDRMGAAKPRHRRLRSYHIRRRRRSPCLHFQPQTSHPKK